jgi:O-antigen ligase
LTAGLEVWERSPLFGHGPASFAYSTGRGGQAHNLYGQTLSEVGAMGFLAFLAMVVCYFWNWREARRHALADPMVPAANNFPYQVARAVGLIIILLLGLGWSGHILFRYNWQWLAAFSSVALACLRVRATTAAQQGPYCWSDYAPLPGQG